MSTPMQIIFDYKQVKWLASKSKEKVFIVHDDGTYLMSDSDEKVDGHLLLIRPTNGGWEAGRGDDFGEEIPLNLLQPDSIVKSPETLVLDFSEETFRILIDGKCIHCNTLLSKHKISVKGKREFYVCPTKKREKSNGTR